MLAISSKAGIRNIDKWYWDLCRAKRAERIGYDFKIDQNQNSTRWKRSTWMKLQFSELISLSICKTKFPFFLLWQFRLVTGETYLRNRSYHVSRLKANAISQILTQLISHCSTLTFMRYFHLQLWIFYSAPYMCLRLTSCWEIFGK